MKNALLKFAGLFIEKVPVDERGNPLPVKPAGAPGAAAPPAPAPGQPAAPAVMQPGAAHPGHGAGQQQPYQPQEAYPPGTGQPHPGQPQQPGMQGAPPVPPVHGSGPQISVALRAWVPQEYAAHLAPYGLHVIAAGGSVTSEQARGWGADVLVVSAECLGQDVHLLQQPQMPTVFITPQPVMIPDVPGVLQVQEPLRASDIAQAARDAAAAFAGAHR